MDEKMIEQKAIEIFNHVNYCDDSEKIDVIRIAKKIRLFHW